MPSRPHMHPVFANASPFAELDKAYAYVANLPDLSVLAFTGRDSKTFLQGQLTNDISQLASSQARLSGYCTAQGRLLASMIVCHESGQVIENNEDIALLALIRSDIAASIVKRLSMFVLRSKVKISLSKLACAGVTLQSSNINALLQLGKLAGGNLPLDAYSVLHTSTGIWIACPQTGTTTRRWWWMSDATTPENELNDTRLIPLKQHLAASSSADWAKADLAAGLPWIEAKTQDAFIPQTINLDVIEGVSFTKGCYPGQEIVARSHYRGTLKRRMAYGRIKTNARQNISAGDDIIDMANNNEICGRIINAVRDGHGFELLFEAPFVALDKGMLTVGNTEESKIELLALPYSVPRPVEK